MEPSSIGPPRRRPLIFDIETISGVPEQAVAAIAPLAAKRDCSVEEYAALCPPLARVACIAWLSTDTGELVVACDRQLSAAAPTPMRTSIPAVDEGGAARDCELRFCDGESGVLAEFGTALEAHLAQPHGILASFNGRGFDLPVLIHRGLILGVERGRSRLLEAVRDHRQWPTLHVDLMDVLTFGGAGSRWPLAAYAVGYGARSPKSEMDGTQVGRAIAAGRLLDVARYCATDVLATEHVFRRSEGLITFGGDRAR